MQTARESSAQRSSNVTMRVAGADDNMQTQVNQICSDHHYYPPILIDGKWFNPNLQSILPVILRLGDKCRWYQQPPIDYGCVLNWKVEGQLFERDYEVNFMIS